VGFSKWLVGLPKPLKDMPKLQTHERKPRLFMK
jgi:hypothetical protein